MDIQDVLLNYELSPKALSDITSIPVRTIYAWTSHYRTPPAYVVNLIIKILDQEVRRNGKAETN